MSQGLNNDIAAVSKTRRVVKNLRWWVLVLFLLGVTVNGITRNSLGIIAPELKATLGITTEQYSWIVGAFQLALHDFPAAVRLAYRRHRPEAWLYDLRHPLGAGLYRPRRGR